MSTDHKAYSVFERDFSSSKLICAPRAALAALSRQKEQNFPNAFYIWPYACTRFHAFRLFTPKRAVVRAETAFLCDNVFDLWINGKQVHADDRHLALTEVTKLIREGENDLHIRGYQSASLDTYSSAITGGLRLFYDDGSVEEIVTDGSFKCVQLTNFWEREEPEGFETATQSRYGTRPVSVTELHPIALRRSFLFVRDIDLSETPVSATLYASALGCYQPYLNGESITDVRFMPFCENYRKEFQSFDLLPFLRVGKNTLGFISGNGSYNCHSWGTLRAQIPQIVAQIELKYADGRIERTVSDGDWLCAPSPLIENDIQYGERYDARLEIEDWCTPNCDRSGFVSVECHRNDELSVLIEQNYPPVKKMREHIPTLISALSDGSLLFDIGTCVSGRASAEFAGLREGQCVRLRYCERLTEDGMPENGAYVTVYYPQDCEREGKSPAFLRNIDVYIAKGAPRERYECRFAYTGFRYVCVEGLDSPEQLVSLCAFELYNDLCLTGEIVTDNEPLSRIFNATKRSWLNNIMNGPTDCPTREKNYWNGDSQIFSHTACWLTDCSALLSRWTDNGKKMHDGPYGWEDETYELPLTLYRFYGDVEILKKRFSQMLALIKKRTEFEGMVLPEEPNSPYCDWLSPTGVTPSKQFFSGCWYYHMLSTVGDIARIIGEYAVADELHARSAAAKEEFNKRHLCADGCDYDAHNQCGIVLPLAFGIAPEEYRASLAKTLVEYIKKEDYHLTTGFIGTRYLPEVLCDFGYTDIAYRLISQTTFPSWLYMLDTGCVSISESWHGMKDPDKSISMAHFSLGSVTGFFFEYLGGIRVKDSTPGMTHVVLKPHPLPEIGSLEVSYKTPRGTVRTQWHYENGRPVFSYSLPEGVSAEVILGE